MWWETRRKWERPWVLTRKKNKNTYPSVNGLDAAYKRLREVTDMAVEAIAGYYDNAEFFRDLVLRLAVRKK